MVNRTTIQQVPPGEHVPASEPKRYRNSQGYVRLRWKLGPYHYVECYEHRVVDGVALASGVERHHVNRIRDDNRPENLQTLTPSEHEREHACDVLDDIVRLYQEGHSTPAVARMVGRDSAVVYRHLVAEGVELRNRVERLTDDERDRIAELFRAGHPWSEVEKMTGRSLQTLAAVRRRYSDIPKRRPGPVPRGSRAQPAPVAPAQGRG